MPQVEHEEHGPVSHRPSGLDYMKEGVTPLREAEAMTK
jgi:hypothetical protein